MTQSIKLLVIASIVIGLLISSCFAGTIRIDRDFDNKLSSRFDKALPSELNDTKTTVYINSPGGSTDVLEHVLQVMAQIQQKHPVQCIVPERGWAASAAAAFLMHCSSIKVAPNAIVLFHVARVCTDGTCEKIDYYIPWNIEPSLGMYKVFKPIATPDEMRRFKNNEDIAIPGYDLMNRLK